MMTEDEARKKWCPFMQGEESGNCLASDCAAWRWVLEHQFVDAPDHSSGGSMQWVQTDKGYCGLAGQP